VGLFRTWIRTARDAQTGRSIGRRASRAAEGDAGEEVRQGLLLVGAEIAKALGSLESPQ
jgi:hypothetical protein